MVCYNVLREVEKGSTRKTQDKRKANSMSKPNFAFPSDYLDEDSKEEAKVLLSRRDEILDQLAEAGLSEDPATPYVYNVPTNFSFDCGRGKDLPMRSLYAIVVMARASHASANFLDTDKEGFPELPQFCGGTERFHREHITDPFAWHIDEALRRQRLIKQHKVA